MLVAGESQQEAAQQGAAPQVERPAHLLGGAAGDFLLPAVLGQRAELDDGQIQDEGRRDDLHRALRGFGERRPEDLMAPDDLVEAALERGDVKRTPQAQGARHVVDRRGRAEPIQEPQALLGERQGRRPARRASRDRLGRRAAHGPVAQRLYQDRPPLRRQISEAILRLRGFRHGSSRRRAAHASPPTPRRLPRRSIPSDRPARSGRPPADRPPRFFPPARGSWAHRGSP